MNKGQLITYKQRLTVQTNPTTSDTAKKVIEKDVEKLTSSIDQSRESSQLMDSLAQSLPNYISYSTELAELISVHTIPVADANRILQQQLDSLAGTADIGILINLMESMSDLRKFLEIDAIVSGLKQLRAAIDDFVANTLLESITGDMTDWVNRWYEKIKTEGDPDVHFKSFDLERTKTGKIKARKVQVKASSYGIELVSAVSSLSESKLNALGLCMSLAMSLEGSSPFDFIFIDDPIQSLDVEHATQFVQIIRELVEDQDVQVIILSHNKSWLDQVRSGCRSLNGSYSEITGYTKNGPTIVSQPWIKWRQRLDTVDAILKDSQAGTVKLQQAEEEIRLVLAEITCQIYLSCKNKQINPNNLNASRVNKLLIECSINNSLTDRIAQAFETIDDSHHESPGYVPDRERIRRFHS